MPNTISDKIISKGSVTPSVPKQDPVIVPSGGVAPIIVVNPVTPITPVSPTNPVIPVTPTPGEKNYIK